MAFRPPAVRNSLALACLIALSLPLPSTAAAQNTDSSQAERGIQLALPAARLGHTLDGVASAGGISLSYDPALVSGLSAPPLQGRYTVRAALAQALAGTGLVAREVARGAWSIQRVAGVGAAAIVTDTLQVGGDRPVDASGAERDERGYDDVYDLDLSTVYAGREQIERYKGAAPADVFKGMVNVYSGDARNSGALDPNIRGIQGPGRVPLTIDGTEQALTVWRGYMGANNRNYIDPSLIGGMQVIKGPALVRGANTSVGGAVQVKTLDVDDILMPGETFGGELKLEASDNAVDPRLPRLLTGQPIGSVPGFPGGLVNFYDPTLYQHPRSKGGGSTFGHDQAWRLALGLRKDNFDVMAAYAFREKGNHFAGRHGSSFYDNEPVNAYDYVPYLAKVYPTGSEILNSSNRMESWLVKATWRLGEEQVLQLNVRDTDSLYGEIMPSRIQWASTVTDGIPQWPLSQVQARAVNLEYKWRPSGLDWVDLRANLWRTDTDSATYSSGGLPNDGMNWYSNQDKAYVTPDHYRNTAVANSRNARTGFSFDNTMQLRDNLDLTVGGNIQRETLRSKDLFDDPETTGYWSSKPREGWRREYDLSALLEWRPIEKLQLSAGVRYQNWQAFDDLLARQQRAGIYATSATETAGRSMTWTTLETYTQAQIDANVASARESAESSWWMYEMFGVSREEFDAMIESDVERARSTTSYEVKHETLWRHDGQGRYNRAGNPCVNGEVDLSKVVLNGTYTCMTSATYPGQSINGELVPSTTIDTTARRKHGAGWVPSFAATYEFSEHSRIYLRHSQVRRFPALFESTIGFSSTPPTHGLKPEHAYNTEISWVQDFGQLLDGNPLADLKIAYYHHRTKDVIERSPQLTFSNVDEQTIRGIEVQGRYDNGRFFTDISGAWNLENRVCDEHTAMLLDPSGGVSNCVDTGFVGGYLVTMAIPRYTFNWTVGTRLFDGRLELGSRIVHHAPQESVFTRNYGDQSAMISYYLNTPLQWGRITTYDAYANLRINDRATVELVGTNLGNLYYIDPLTRSSMLAPGRTLKMSFNYRF